LEESEGTENTETRVKTFYVKTGIAAKTEERLQVEEEEALAGVPTERRTGCYHFPAVTEVVRQPGFQSSRETELALRPAPQGCIKVTLIAPEIGLEYPFEGSLEPEAVNGTRNALNPSVAFFKGGFIGTEVEKSSERNERALRSIAGPAYAKSLSFMKVVGGVVAHMELHTLK
jgi:hypothetical protein